MAVDAIEILYQNPEIQSFVFVTRDSDFLPALLKVKKKGKNAIVVMINEEAAISLKNTADEVIILEKGALNRSPGSSPKKEALKKSK
jgi:uncharacterized protein (TIGR00288 family)